MQSAMCAQASTPPRRYLGWGVLSVPPTFDSPDGSFDLIVHFHGATDVMERNVARARLNALLVTVNFGGLSKSYEDAFAGPAACNGVMHDIEQAVQALGFHSSPRLRRLALSAWSAGYAGVAQWLSHGPAVEQLDAVLLADALHAGYLDDRRKTLDPFRMEPFLSFANEASSGAKLMAVAHTAVDTQGYASTTETARHLLGRLQVTPRELQRPRSDGLLQTSEASDGDFHVPGFAGQDRQAHSDQLRHIDSTLLSLLRNRWQQDQVSEALAALCE